MRAGIVGSGIMGRLLAFALHNAGWQVSLFDRSSESMSCSTAAAGLLTPFSELDKSILLISTLGQESIKNYWPRIIEDLPEAVYFQQSGSLVLCHPGDQAEWIHFSRRILSQLNPSNSVFQKLSHENLIALEPELTKFETAYYFPNEAHIDCQTLMLSLKNYLDSVCIPHITNTPVLSLKPGEINTKEQRYHFDVVFDCRGLGAQNIFSDLRGIRGELIWLHAPGVQLHRPIRLLHPRYSLYLVPRPGNLYLIGASEIEAEDFSPVSVRTTLELLTAVYYLHGNFDEARIIKTVTHCRPTLANHLPRIKFADGLIAVNGLYRHGYLIAPALAEEILRGVTSNFRHLNYPELWESYCD
ncbi:TPA: FAD-dependent oxidoreductase [Legionella pneumophila]|uniref:FAD-dependent oxidoreductase n=1 Tax=Legionella pneumophila TaxID=446 RepID=UPI000488571A|nr:FAD-dependent oxidoreductase [Legionella pneumophila]MDI9843603.1 FAD-dependent oxidoreductase [Legionella pneumophila]MDW8865633.1 FAD-dependent oxidoreductase [Legionella pneumophila]MDW9172672.1 FAD-dependent oxidoreductase [Legionella pneumophila]HAT1977707.1 FAD-dependent oxidoreductase [Legionella pneumophila]HAT4426416.1 FAD-dependent oxidoreductase [Legionella pneumophila]